jgi:hypothetical protein
MVSPSPQPTLLRDTRRDGRWILTSSASQKIEFETLRRNTDRRYECLSVKSMMQPTIDDTGDIALGELSSQRQMAASGDRWNPRIRSHIVGQRRRKAKDLR